MKEVQFNREKDKVLLEKRGIGFEDIKQALENGKLLNVVKHPNSKRYPRQKMFLIELNNYVFMVPFIEEREYIFLKTIIPSRKYTKKEVKKYTQLFREASKKDKRITIRVSSNDLEDIQKKAKYTGIPYQTLIASILHQFASGKVQIDM